MFARLKILALAAVVLLTAATPGLARDGDPVISAKLLRTLNGVDTAVASTGSPVAVWVRFADKGLTEPEMADALARAANQLTAAAHTRRARRSVGGALVDAADLPLASGYLEAVAATGASPRRQSRWLNAASFNATPAQIEAIARLPFVAEVDLVARGRGEKPRPLADMPAALQARLDAGKDKTLGPYDYGASGPGLEQINVPESHAMGLTGKGVRVAIFDTGFELSHECLEHLDIVATYDFINDDEFVGSRKNEDPDQTVYGTAALSVLAGFSRSNLIGPAYNASVILAKTEDLESETPAEEDNWIAALEWAEGLGVDIVSSGLGYYYWYEFGDMDGRTAPITVAAEMAAMRGVCVINGVGDQANNPEWPHLLPPADGRNVIAVGSVDLNDQVTWFSSPGPTADGRIKPDVVALGYGHPAAVSRVDDLYNYSYGTNFTVPLVAGVVAMLLEQNPSLSPIQVMEALHNTASRADLPDNRYGWGIIDAQAVLSYWAPAIDHAPLKDTEGGTGSHRVTATIVDRQGVDVDRLHVAWRLEGQNWILEPMSSDGDDVYTGQIPPQDRRGSNIEYYIVATGADGRTSNHPADAPSSFHRFREGPDTIGPVIGHLGLADITTAHWPPTIKATATDNKGVAALNLMYTVPGLGTQGPIPLVDMGDHYEIEFPVPVEAVFPGFTITYLFTATDTASKPNTVLGGPFSFKVVANKGSVLLVDDRNNSKSLNMDRPGASGAEPADKSASLLADWLTDAGFAVDIMPASAVQSSSFQGYDAVMLSCGGNFGPFVYPDLRRSMIAWVENGGKIMIEGGETAYASTIQPGYPDLVGTVLPIESYGGEDGATLYRQSDYADHPLLNRPHNLPNPFVVDNSGGFDYGAADLADRSAEAFVALQTGLGSTRGGMIAYDNNTGPESGQIIYLPVNLAKAIDKDGRALLDNAMTWLLATEPPGSGSISGRVILAGTEDYSGITVRVGSTHSTVSATDGTYTLTGLWGGNYKVIVEGTGYAPSSRRIDVVDDQETTQADFYLVPVTEVNFSSAPGIAIPDNNPDGVADTIEVAEGGEVFGISIDGNFSHFAIGQLVVTLTSPAGTQVVLHNRTGGTSDNLVGNWPDLLFVDGPGSLDDFLGEDSRGTWTLQVADKQLGALGTFQSWGLNLLLRASGVAPADDRLPPTTRLVGNAPNPFNPRTTISFELAAAGPVQMDIFDVRGRLVRRLADRNFPLGRHNLIWDGRNQSGGDTASGLYFYRLRAGDTEQTDKMLLVR